MYVNLSACVYLSWHTCTGICIHVCPYVHCCFCMCFCVTMYVCDCVPASVCLLCSCMCDTAAHTHTHTHTHTQPLPVLQALPMLFQADMIEHQIKTIGRDNNSLF